MIKLTTNPGRYLYQKQVIQDTTHGPKLVHSQLDLRHEGDIFPCGDDQAFQGSYQRLVHLDPVGKWKVSLKSLLPGNVVQLLTPKREETRPDWTIRAGSLLVVESVQIDYSYKPTRRGPRAKEIMLTGWCPTNALVSSVLNHLIQVRVKRQHIRFWCNGDPEEFKTSHIIDYTQKYSLFEF